MEDKIRAFHLEIRRVATSKDSNEPLGKFQLSTIANVDQTPLPFAFNTGQGYNKTGDKTVWHRGAYMYLHIYTFLQYNGKNLLKIPARDAYSYGRQLLDVLFTKEEQMTSLVFKSRRSTKPPLEEDRVELLFSK